MSMRWSLVGVAVTMSVIAQEGCIEPAGSPFGPTAVTVGRDFTGTASRGDTVRYTFDTSVGVAFVAVLTALDDTVRMAVRDSLGRDVSYVVTSTPVAGADAPVPSANIGGGPRARYHLLVTGRGRFRLRLVESRPEGAPATITSGTVIEEAIDELGDVDEFVYQGAPGDLVIAFIRALDATGRGAVGLSIGSAGAVSTPADTALEDQTTGRILLTSTEPVRVVVRGSYIGRYQLLFRRIETAPEHVAADPPVRTVITAEALDYVGDVDRYTVRAPAGTLVKLFFRMANGRPSQAGTLEVTNLGDVERPLITSTGADSGVFLHSTARVRVPASGALTFEVSGLGKARGSYELLVHQVDPQPEGTITALQPGDTITGAIELPGDIDEFPLTLPAATLLNLHLSADPYPDHYNLPVTGALLDANGAVLARMVDTPSGRVALGAGTYRVRIEGVDDQVAPFRGRYQLATERIDPRPEGTSATLTIGARVTETLDPAADLDTYEFIATSGESIAIQVRALAAPPYALLGYTLIRRLDDEEELDAVAIMGPDTGDNPGSGARLDARWTGPYRLLVSLTDRGRSPLVEGQYTVELVRLDASKGPEHHRATVTAGEAVTDERMDASGDIDEFVLTGTPGSEVSVVLTAFSSAKSLKASLADAATGDTLRTTQSYGAAQSLGRIVMPSSGRLRVLVYPEGGLDGGLYGPYRLDTWVTNRAPESRAPTIAVGDTITGEGIDHAGDVDEFRFTGTAGQRLAVLFDRPIGGGLPGFVLEVSALNGTVPLASVTAFNPGDPFGDRATPVFTLPAAGTYIVRVREVDEANPDPRPYRFAVLAR